MHSANKTFKIAFCFLVIKNIKNINAWRDFFKGHEEYYTIYSHISGPNYNDSNYQWQPELWNNRVETYDINHTNTKWGTVSLVIAEGLMYQAALIDSNNKYFCVISESDIPVVSFKELYNFLNKSNKSNKSKKSRKKRK